MKIGYLSTLYHTSFILKNGKFSYKNFDDIEWILFPTGPAMMKAFRSGTIDLGYIGLPPVMIGIETGIKIKCVAGGHVEGTVMIADESYQSYDELGNEESVLKQFTGRNIGTPTRGSIHDVIIRSIIDDQDINIVNYPWADFIPDAIVNNEIDAGLGTPSLATASNMQFNSKIIIPPNKLWPYNPSYGIIAQEQLISDDPEFIYSFLKAHEDACNLIRKTPKIAAEIVVKEMGVVDEDFVLKTYSISPRYCAKLSEEYIRSTMDFIPVLIRLGYMNRELNVDEIFDTNFIESIHKENSHY